MVKSPLEGVDGWSDLDGKGDVLSMMIGGWSGVQSVLDKIQCNADHPLHGDVTVPGGVDGDS